MTCRFFVIWMFCFVYHNSLCVCPVQALAIYDTVMSPSGVPVPKCVYIEEFRLLLTFLLHHNYSMLVG